LSAGGSISGTATDGTSAGIENVTIQVGAFSGTVVKAALSDGSGVWVVRGLPPGTYFARTALSNSDHHLDEAYSGIPCAPSCPAITTTTPISVVGSGTTAGIDFSLSAGACISGVVTNSATASPVVGVTVTIYSKGVPVKEVSTDAAGVYVAAGLPPGTYYARTKVPLTVNLVDEWYDNVPCCSSLITPITVVGTSMTGYIDFALSSGGTIAGRVTEDGTGSPLAGVPVSIRGLDSARNVRTVVKTVVSDATGHYVATGLAPGIAYDAFTSVSSDRNYLDQLFDHRTCFDCSGSVGDPITVSGTGTTSNIDFALTTGGTITGTVTDARTGAPAPDVTVDIYKVVWSTHGVRSLVSWKTAVTRPDGTYSVTGLPPTSEDALSQYLARILPSGTQLGAEYRDAIALAAGETVSGIDFTLYATGDADIVADFGNDHGLWMLGSDNHWQQLHWMSPVAMIRADVDGNHEDDLIVNFGPATGVWAWMNHATWRFIHPSNPTQMVAADLDRDGRDDLIMAFPSYGVWRWVDSDVWTHLDWLDASLIAVNHGTLIVDFPVYGLWTYSLKGGWRFLHPLSATTLVVDNLVDSFSGGILLSGFNDVVVGFPGYGLWCFVDERYWIQLHQVTPTLTATGSSGLVVDFGPPYGIWTTKSGSGWTQIQEMSAQSIVLADRTADGQDEIIIDFRDGHGLWQMRNAALNTLNQLHVLSPKSVIAGRFH
jgi:hypothetical protein